jgi:hypothetical protein
VALIRQRGDLSLNQLLLLAERAQKEGTVANQFSSLSNPNTQK